MSTLDLCEKYFGTRDLYKLFEVDKNALPKDIKKAYYKRSLEVHPDRVNEKEKQEATEKFKVLSKIYQALSDKDKRALYDEQGIIDDEDDLDSKLTSWMELWRKMFKPLSEEDISNYEKSYVNSELERSDIKKAYLSGKGCINHMMNEVPFLGVKDEPRLQKIVGEMINAKEVPEYKIFTNEPKQKRDRRHKKHARESKEADEIKKKLSSRNNGNLEQQIMQRQQSREDSYNTLMNKLMEKYGGGDDSEVIDLHKGTKKKKAALKNATPKVDKMHSVHKGRVNKNKK